MLPFEYTISHIAGAKIGMADYLSRSPKFEAPPTSKYDEQFVGKTIEIFDEACRVISTPATDKKIGKVQLVKAHLEKNRTNTKKLTFDVNASERKYLDSEAPEGGVDNPHKNFTRSEHRIRTAKFDKTFDTDGSSFIQSKLDMHLYILPREGATSCGFHISQLDQFMQIYIPYLQIGILRGKNFNQSNQDVQIYNSQREGGNSCGESLNQSKSSILNLFTTSSHLTSSSREDVVIESNQSEAAELYSVKKYTEIIVSDFKLKPHQLK